ncbi:MAG: hypothetical protein D8M58_10800 [Calditrichaeota bacterium]|nr:MAG: hypothetical protein DWQ03_10175 [Calditrichota bacterium]MBL1205880.1 hypothetical protein [Calditrichota bacterium]NOG45708.1 hypothetical protein [Calditrichota bacterium]
MRQNICYAIIIIFFVVGIAPGLFAQNDFTKIDRHADAAPQSLKNSIPALVNYLTRPAKNDLEKVRSIFRWITQNINYDVEAFFDRRLIVDDPERVIRSGRAVCGGYAELFNRMCREAGIKSKLIAGWSKGYGERLTGRPNHAWNAVKINYRWYLLDATWGAGHINSEKFTRQFNGHYFLTDPNQLIYDHLPEDESWQLLKKPITRKQFDNLVLMRPAFFKNGLKLKSHLNSKISSNGNLLVELEAPENTFLSVKLVSGENQLDDHHSFVQRKNSVYFVNANFPGNGNYIMRLFTKIGRDTEQYNWACDYQVTVTNNTSKNKLFVKQYGKFFDLNAFVHQPVNFVLSEGSKQNFKIELKNAYEMVAVINEEFFPLEKSGDIFEGSILIPKGLFHMAVKTDTTNYYHWLLEYEGK